MEVKWDSHYLNLQFYPPILSKILIVFITKSDDNNNNINYYNNINYIIIITIIKFTIKIITITTFIIIINKK